MTRASAGSRAVASIITQAQAEFIGSTDRLHAFTVLLSDTAALIGAAQCVLHEVPLGHADRGLGARPTDFVEVARARGADRSPAPDPAEAIRMDAMAPHFHAIARTHAPVLLQPIEGTPESSRPGRTASTDSCLIMPIVHDGETIGMLTLTARPSVLQPSDIELLQPITALLAQLLEVWRITRLHRQDQRSIARLSQVAQQMRHGMVITNAEGRVEWVNDAFVDTIGIAVPDALGRFPGELSERLGVDSGESPTLLELLEGGQPFSGEYRRVNRKHGSETWFEITATPFINADGMPEGLMIMMSDISERRRIEQMKDDFVSTVSHELRTPLTSISGALSLLGGGIGGPLEDSLHEMVSIAQRNSRRLTRLIDDLLDLDKLAAGKLRIDLEVRSIMELVDEACVENQVYADGYGVCITCSTRADLAHVEVDPQRFQQVLRNLLSNAVKFSTPGDVVDVRVTANDRLVQLHVVDQGAGIRESFKPYIFTKFAQDGTPDRRAAGTGLGLAISHDLVGRMGGMLDFASAEGRGSTFTVTLPRCRPKGP